MMPDNAIVADIIISGGSRTDCAILDFFFVDWDFLKVAFKAAVGVVFDPATKSKAEADLLNFLALAIGQYRSFSAEYSGSLAPNPKFPVQLISLSYHCQKYILLPS